MKFAICNETFLDWPFDKAFALARDCGYTGIEIAPFTIDTDARRISPKRRTEVRRQADHAGLEVIGLHWLLAKTEGFHVTTPDAAIRAATAGYLVELARLCRDLGGSLMVFGSPAQRNLPPGVSHDDGMKHAADVFQQAMPALEELDVTLAIEPLGPAEGNFLLTAAVGVRLVEMVGSSHCRLHLDCKAMSTEPAPIAEIIRRSAPWLAHFHANDPNQLGPGFGSLDFDPIFEALGQIDYRGWVSVEVFDYTPGVERLARESIDYMHGCLGRLGFPAISSLTRTLLP
ncbi:MAG TPA: sugar phosphate isomerase/epimerase family protein [Pirellulales bacterium]|nr:sugar phosphate isomerase/epimerase family protein [Pirellulales bacterium]